MENLEGNVAVVTGAGSGIGRAMVDRFAAEGMKIVLADVEAGALEQAERELRAGGATVLAVRTDVRQADQVDALAEKTLAAFGAVHVVCNNAGVSVTKSCWDHTLADWEWVLGVNLWGVIHGVRAFVPIMLDQGTEGHIVNTASMSGLTTGAFMASYRVSKHGVVALSEELARELAQIGAPLKVSVLCPGPVRTRILTSARNRPHSLVSPSGSESARVEAQNLDALLHKRVEDDGMPPAEIANHVVGAIRSNRFYILPHPAEKERIRARMEAILEERNPPS
jgi:NAD(P)-dependent dehydrogenase (short-subunit alcohol dehydrogenase family)